MRVILLPLLAVGLARVKCGKKHQLLRVRNRWQSGTPWEGDRCWGKRKSWHCPSSCRRHSAPQYCVADFGRGGSREDVPCDAAVDYGAPPGTVWCVVFRSTGYPPDLLKEVVT